MAEEGESLSPEDSQQNGLIVRDRPVLLFAPAL
jgi:hypothetical protein